jgi:phage shock protein A
MRWFETFTLIMRTNITTLREKIEDPERVLHQLFIDMEQELENVRTSVAGAIADEIQLGKKVERSREDAAQWMQRATASLKRGDEKAAELALEQKVLSEERADHLAAEFEKQKQQTTKLHQAVRDQEDKIRQARQKQTLLLARMVRADSATRINKALGQCESKSAFAQFSRLEQRVERAEAISQAYDRLDDRDPGAEELERTCAEAERKERMARELEALKNRMANE